MATRSVQRPDSPESKSDASASGPGLAPAGISLSPDLAERITRRAYEIAERRGFSPGHELDDWLARSGRSRRERHATHRLTIRSTK